MADYLKIPELARRLDVSEKTARRYIKGGALASTFIGGAYRVTEEDLETFLHRAEVKPENASPKAERRSSPEPSLFNGLDEERRLSRFSEAIIGTAAKWGEAVTDPDMNDKKRLAIIEAALQLSSVISERAEDEDWDAIPNQERLEIVATMEKLRDAAEQGLRYVQESEEAKAQEEQVNQRREQVREWTRRISA